jgi:Tol biopolymer transport system component/tRNA A-37 threonylcarbamoyl transferase component Bud32
MGEVYRATDTKLGRDVALKLLPEALASDPDRLSRFEREARLLAALNHTSIAHLYGFETVALEDGRTVHLLVMELVEGEDLAERLKRGPIPLEDSLAVARQIAEALEEAHEKGIVHRDLKPANVKLTPDGRVKVLDFGLAKAWTGDAPAGTSSADLSQSPTMARTGTEAGMILGTAAYMSPEQARGKAVDKKADVWAFGVVLWEMLTGEQLFAGETVSDVLAAVLTREPEWAVLPARAQGRVRELLRRCLERNPRQRLHDIADARILLEEILSGAPLDVPLTPASGGSARLREKLLLGALAVASLVAAGLGWALARRSLPGPQVVAFARVTDDPGVEATPTLSPDGKSVVYAKTVGTDTDLYLLRVGSRNPVRLTPDSPAEDLEPAFSPDGERIAFRSGRDGGGIFVMTASGESVTRLTDFGFSPSWSPDGSEIVVSPIGFSTPTGLNSVTPGLSIVSVKTGQRRALATEGAALQPAWSPRGARIACWGVRGGSGQRDIWTVAADGSDAAGGGVPVTNDAALDWSPTWSPDGRYLYFSSTRGGTMNLWRVPIDERSGRVLGEPEPITTPSTWSGALSFSRDGTRLVFASLDYRSTLFRVPFDAAREAVVGSPVPALKGTRPIRDHETSPDGEWVAFTEAGVREDLFVARVDGTRYRRLTDDAFRDRGPAWAPDGTRIAFYSDRSGDYELWTIRPDGSGLVQLTSGTGTAGFPTWSPDGKTIAFGAKKLYLVDPHASSVKPTAEPSISGSDSFFPTSWSSTGGRIAGIAMVADSDAAVSVYSLSTKQFTRVPGDLAHGWFFSVWLADGRRLLVRRSSDVVLVNADTGVGRSLFAVGGDIIGHTIGISRDNRWITYTETATEGDVWIATFRGVSR